MKLTAELIQSCRDQFPALSRRFGDDQQPAVFFDGPAGTQVPTCVAKAISEYLLNCNSNTHGQFATSRESDQWVRQAHLAHADFVGASDPDEIIFGQNMTSLTFSFSRSIAQTWNEGDEIILSSLDHDANINPWLLCAAERGVKVHFIDFDRDDFRLNMSDFESKLNDKTRLVAVGCACNATGGINPVKQIAELAHHVGAWVFLDAVHYGPHGLIDVVEWGCDFLACSDYKFFGPHLGMVWGKRSLLEALTPYKVRPSSNELPKRWMTGTQSFESIVGGMACIDYLADLGRQVSDDAELNRRESLVHAFDAIVEYEQALSLKLISGLSAIDGLEIYGVTDPAQVDLRFPTFSIRHRDLKPRELAKSLGEQGIFVWSGNYYALEFSTRMGFEPDGMVRIGLVHYNTPAEIDRLLHGIEQAVC